MGSEPGPKRGVQIKNRKAALFVTRDGGKANVANRRDVRTGGWAMKRILIVEDDALLNKTLVEQMRAVE